jgi:hypothetical protein
MPYRLTRAEQETVITRSPDEAEWTVYTCDPAVNRRLAKITSAIGVSPSIVDQYGVEVRLPLSCLRLTTPVVVSAQERARRVERGKRLAAARTARLSAAGQEQPCESARSSTRPREQAECER